MCDVAWGGKLPLFFCGKNQFDVIVCWNDIETV